MFRKLVVLLLGLGMLGLATSPAEAVSPKRKSQPPTAAQQAAIQQATLTKKKHHHHHHHKKAVKTAAVK